MKSSSLGAIRQPWLQRSKAMPMPLKEVARTLSLLALDNARNGQNQGNALLVSSAPGQRAILLKIVVGEMGTRTRMVVTKAMIILPRLAVVRLLKTRKAVADPHLLVINLNLLLASEESLLQAKLTDLLALDF